MDKTTVHQLLGFLDARIELLLKKEADLYLDSWDRGRVQAYQDIKAYLLIESSMPEAL